MNECLLVASISKIEIHKYFQSIFVGETKYLNAFFLTTFSLFVVVFLYFLNYFLFLFEFSRNACLLPAGAAALGTAIKTIGKMRYNILN